MIDIQLLYSNLTTSSFFFKKKCENVFVFPSRYKVLVIPPKWEYDFRVNCILKNLTLKIFKLFLFQRLLFYLFRLKKNGGHLTNFLSEEQNLPPPPQILRIIQYCYDFSYAGLYVVLVTLYSLISHYLVPIRFPCMFNEPRHEISINLTS